MRAWTPCWSTAPPSSSRPPRAGRPIATEDPCLICRSPHIDVIVEVTGHVDFGLHVTLEAMNHGKHVVLMNAELDATLGPILQVHAKRHGVILSACDGDEPGVQMNLYRWVKGLGLTPRVMGNIKGLQDPYRNPTTQAGFAEKWGQNPAMVTSFADGSKISFEQSIVANATGFKVRSRGMSRGLEYKGDIMEIGKLYDIDELRELGGVVDYVVGTPLTKVYCLAEHPDPKQQHYLNLYKMGPGPALQLLRSLPPRPFRGAVRDRARRACSAIRWPSRSVRRSSRSAPSPNATSRRGEVLDCPGEYMTYGEACNSDEMEGSDYLPEGLVEGCTLMRAIKRDQVITYDDVTLPARPAGRRVPRRADPALLRVGSPGKGASARGRGARTRRRGGGTGSCQMSRPKARARGPPRGALASGFARWEAAWSYADGRPGQAGS